jgi:hypothetical protein
MRPRAQQMSAAGCTHRQGVHWHDYELDAPSKPVWRCEHEEMMPTTSFEVRATAPDFSMNIRTL